MDLAQNTKSTKKKEVVKRVVSFITDQLPLSKMTVCLVAS